MFPITNFSYNNISFYCIYEDECMRLTISPDPLFYTCESHTLITDKYPRNYTTSTVMESVGYKLYNFICRHFRDCLTGNYEFIRKSFHTLALCIDFIFITGRRNDHWAIANNISLLTINVLNGNDFHYISPDAIEKAKKLLYSSFPELKNGSININSKIVKDLHYEVNCNNFRVYVYYDSYMKRYLNLGDNYIGYLCIDSAKVNNEKIPDEDLVYQKILLLKNHEEKLWEIGYLHPNFENKKYKEILKIFNGRIYR